MHTTTDHEAAERDMRDLLERGGLPQPDEVEYRERSVLMLWHETKLAVFIDLDERPPGEEGPGYCRAEG